MSGISRPNSLLFSGITAPCGNAPENKEDIGPESQKENVIGSREEDSVWLITCLDVYLLER